jgi:hypothetical protein
MHITIETVVSSRDCERSSDKLSAGLIKGGADERLE